MTLRLKLFLGIFTFFSVTLAFFGYIANNAASLAIAKSEMVFLQELSNSVIRDLGDKTDSSALNQVLRRFASDNVGIAVLSQNRQVVAEMGSVKLPEAFRENLTNDVFGATRVGATNYFWYIARLPNSVLSLRLMRAVPIGIEHMPLIYDFGVSLMFAVVIVLGVALWSAVYVAALLKNLTTQREKIAHQALHDNLTSLPNRSLMNDRLQNAIHTAQRETSQLALLFIDLNNFKDINDTLGHHCGDQFLVEVANRLSVRMRKSDTVARLGGDEFAIVLRNIEMENANGIARQIATEIERSFEIEGKRCFVSASIGIALYPVHGDSATALVQCADVAMYAAKKTGGGLVVYSADLDAFSLEKLTLGNDLRAAIEQHQLSVFYQPKINIDGKHLIGAEALLRWKHPEFGFVPPDKFIAIGEDVGLMGAITECVLDNAFREFGEFLNDKSDLTLAINLSACSLQSSELAKLLSAATNKWKIDPKRVVLEITESAMMANPANSSEVLTTIAKLGFNISLDDFGTGYSSLVNLRRLPVQEIKIDRAFVMGMRSSDEDAAIVRAIIELGHSLDKLVVAEGVESAEVMQALADLHCDILQGFLISRPLPIEQFKEWKVRSGY